MSYPYEDSSNITPAMTAEIMRSIAKTLLDKAEQLDPVGHEEPPQTKHPHGGLQIKQQNDPYNF
jgi:hypothetical protein